MKITSYIITTILLFSFSTAATKSITELGKVKIDDLFYNSGSELTSVESEKIKFNQAKKILDKAIYGHKEAKMHILQVIGQWITNPTSGGNVLALQGPMGNGKTTLFGF